jgi:hypothetical protein
VNQKTISRRSFSQVIHIRCEHNFSFFWVATTTGIQGNPDIRETPVLRPELHRPEGGFQSPVGGGDGVDQVTMA